MHKAMFGIGIATMIACVFGVGANALEGDCPYNHDCLYGVTSVMRVHRNTLMRWHNCNDCEYYQQHTVNAGDLDWAQDSNNTGDSGSYSYGHYYGRHSEAHVGRHHNTRR